MRFCYFVFFLELLVYFWICECFWNFSYFRLIFVFSLFFLHLFHVGCLKSLRLSSVVVFCLIIFSFLCFFVSFCLKCYKLSIFFLCLSRFAIFLLFVHLHCPLFSVLLISSRFFVYHVVLNHYRTFSYYLFLPTLCILCFSFVACLLKLINLFIILTSTLFFVFVSWKSL